jgi:CheY-like chemotaxis protein
MLRERETVLLAEDNEDEILLMRRALTKIGYAGRFQIVTDGEEALDYLRADGKYADRTQYPVPSLFVTDLKMPRKNGFDVLRWLNAHPERAIIPIIVLSSSAQEEDIRLAYRLGANSYFVKPSDFTALQELIVEILHYWSLCERPMVEPD